VAAPSQERWGLIEPLLDRALDTPSDSRAGFLSDACSADPALREDVERLLQASENSDAFFGQPALAYASPVVDWVAERQAMASGDWVGPYLIEGKLGQGGMATVYLAHDPRHGRRVALKLLRPEISGALGAERFAREIGIAARLSHPRILPLYDSGTVERPDSPPLVFYTMPYIVGCSLRDRLREQNQLPVPEAVEVARQVASALEYAHREGVVHRDIKPENILLADGEARVADFGIARALDMAGEDRLTDAGIAIGTPAYMSPEQATGSGHLDGRADQYALACVLYEMLAGEPPFTGSTSQAVLARHATDPVPSLRTVRPGVSPDLARVITRALAKVAADRFPSVGAFADALAAPHPDAPEIERSGGGSPSRSRRRVAATVAAAALALSVPFAFLTNGDRREVAVLDPAMIAVAPFRVAAADTMLGYLREGMVDLLAAKLQVEAGVRPVDPRSTLSTWRRLIGPDARDVAPDAPLRLARGVGAGRVIDGSIVGAGHDLTLSASLLRSADAKVVAMARVEGPIDSLSVLLDRLAARLLTLDAGVVPSRLSAMSTSLPAIRAFLAGRAAFRLGELGEAFRQFRDATLLDSTFALAAFELVHVSLWLDWGDDARRGLRLAEAGRSRLSRDDVALLDAWPLITRFPTAPEFLERWRVAAEAFPDRADIWYWFGDAYYHSGRSLGLEDRLDLALQAFRRGWALDSANTMHSLTALRSPQFVEPLNHMVEIAQMKADTASVLRLTRLGLSADSTGEWGWYLRWHRAAVSGESARRAFWADSERIDPRAVQKIGDFITANGVGSQDWLRAIRLDTRNQEGSRPGMIAQSHAVACSTEAGRRRLARFSSRPTIRPGTASDGSRTGCTGTPDGWRGRCTGTRIPAAPRQPFTGLRRWAAVRCVRAGRG